MVRESHGRVNTDLPFAHGSWQYRAMGRLTRFSASLDSELLGRFDELSLKRGYSNRSEALRDLMRDALVREEWESNQEIVGTITLIYDHHIHELSDRLTAMQHEYHHVILSAMHVHLDEANCLEVIAVKGPAETVRVVGDLLVGTKGVKHGKLTATTTGKRIK